MKVLNRRERTLSFLLFLLLFVITTFAIIVAIYFDYQLPWRENALLKDHTKKISKEYNFQKRFAGNMDEVKSYLDSISKNKEGYFYYNQQAGSKLVDMQRSIPQDSLVHDNMYDNIIIAYKQLLDAKKTLRELDNSRQTIDNLKQQLDTYKEEYEGLKRDLEVCKQLNRR